MVTATATYTVLDGHRKAEITPSVQIVVNGRAIDFATIGQMKKWARAIMNADMRKAGVPPHVANAIAPANQSYVSTAYHLTAEERAQVDAGTRSLAFSHNKKKRERAIEAIIRKDPERAVVVLDRVLDSLTTPTLVPAKK